MGQRSEEEEISRRIEGALQKLRKRGSDPDHEDWAQEAQRRTLEARGEQNPKALEAPEGFAVSIYKNLRTDGFRCREVRERNMDVHVARATLGGEGGARSGWQSEEHCRHVVIVAARREVLGQDGSHGRDWPLRWWQVLLERPFARRLAELPDAWGPAWLTLLRSTPAAERRPDESRINEVIRSYMAHRGKSLEDAQETARHVFAPPPPERVRVRRRKTAQERFAVERKRVASAGIMDGAFANAVFDTWDHRRVTPRRWLVEEFCSVAAPEDERAPEARDLGLAAVLAGEWPHMKRWRKASEAQVIETMSECMRRAHQKAGALVRPLAAA